jgi:hypothetical protein
LSGMGGVRKHAILHFLSLERRVHAVHGRTRTDNREREGGREGGREEGERGEGRRREAGNKRDPIARKSKFYCNTGKNIFYLYYF